VLFEAKELFLCLCRLYLPEKMTSGRLILKAASEATAGEIKVIQTIDYSQRCTYIYVKYLWYLPKMDTFNSDFYSIIIKALHFESVNFSNSLMF
jgi:hypothetical protein